MITFKNSKEILFKVSHKDERGQTELGVFFQKVADLIPNEVTPDELLLAVQIIMKSDIDAHLEEFGENAMPPYMSDIHLIVSQVTPKDFALAFRKLYNEQVMGLYKDDVNEGDYGYVDLGNGWIDISYKNRGDVLAALYNQAQPLGRGYEHHDPTPMNGAIGERVFELAADDTMVEIDGKLMIAPCVKKRDGISFDYLKGRAMKIFFNDNGKINVSSYNRQNGEGLAELAISNCPNIKEPPLPIEPELTEVVIEEVREILGKPAIKKSVEEVNRIDNEELQTNRGVLSRIRTVNRGGRL